MRALASRTCGEATWVYRSVVVTRAQDLLDDADVDALLDEERRRRMPGVVETSVADAGLLEDFFPLAPVFGAADRTAVVLAEDQVVILPVVGHGPFEELLLLVSSEQGQQLSGALEGELGLALALPERGASLPSLRAVPGVLGAACAAGLAWTAMRTCPAVVWAVLLVSVLLAVLRAERAVPLLAALVGVVAAVPPLRALDLEPRFDDAGLQVDVGPAESAPGRGGWPHAPASVTPPSTPCSLSTPACVTSRPNSG
jgi:hypothetical protein